MLFIQCTQQTIRTLPKSNAPASFVHNLHAHSSGSIHSRRPKMIAYLLPTIAAAAAAGGRAEKPLRQKPIKCVRAQNTYSSDTEKHFTRKLVHGNRQTRARASPNSTTQSYMNNLWRIGTRHSKCQYAHNIQTRDTANGAHAPSEFVSGALLAFRFNT